MLALLVAFLLWYVSGLLGSIIAMRTLDLSWREDWVFGLAMAFYGPLNLHVALQLKSRRSNKP